VSVELCIERAMLEVGVRVERSVRQRGKRSVRGSMVAVDGGLERREGGGRVGARLSRLIA